MKKKKYLIEICETSARMVEVSAGSREEAIGFVTADYKAEKIILDSGDFVGVEFNEVRQS